MLTRIPLILIVALGAALIAAGCGDDEEATTSTTTTEAATGATGATGAGGSEFAQQGNEICKEGNKEIDTEARDAFPDSQEPPQADLEKFAEEVVIPNIEQQVDDVAALTPPEGEEDLFDQFIDEAQSAVEEIKSDPSLVTGQGGEDPFAETNELATELGLKECSS